MAEEAPGQEQGRGFEPAGSPETTSPEAQRNQLINTVDRIDKALGGKVVTRIPMSNSDKEVLIFNSIYLNETISHAGVHPDLGPIAVSKSLGDKLEQVKEKFLERHIPAWEQIVEKGDERAVNTIRPEEQEIWDQALQRAVTEARQRIETEQKLAQVLPQTLRTAMRIAEEVNSQTNSEAAPDQQRRPAPPAPSSEPQV